MKSFLVVLHLASAIVLGSSWTAAASEYRLRAGDVIEVSVAGLPSSSPRASTTRWQHHNSTIGTLDVEGELLSDVRERIQAAFTGKLLTVYASGWPRADTYCRARRRLGDRRTICSDLGIGRCCSTRRATLPTEDDGPSSDCVRGGYGRP